MLPILLTLLVEPPGNAPEEAAREPEQEEADQEEARKNRRLIEVHSPLESETRAVSTLSGEKLDETRGEQLGEALARLPGVSVLRSSSGGPGKPIIRGQLGRRNLILYDGVRHEGQKWGIEHAPEIDPFAAGSLSIVKGAAGTRYGPDGVGGVVLVTPPPMRREPGVGGEAHLVGASNGARGSGALRLDGAHAFLPGFAWRVDGNITRGRALVTPDYPLDNTGSFQWNGGGKVAYLRNRFEVELSYRHHFMKAGLCSCIRNASPEEFEQSFSFGAPLGSELYTVEYEIERPFQRVFHDLVIARGRVDWEDKGSFTATYSFQLDEREEYEIVRQGVKGPQFEFDLSSHAGDFQFERSPKGLGEHTHWIGNYGLSVSRLENEFRSIRTLIPDYEQWYGGVYAFERLAHENFELEFGLRYDLRNRETFLTRRDFVGQSGAGRLDLSRCTQNDDRSGQCSHLEHAGSGTLGLLVRPLRGERELGLKFALSSVARFPSIDEHFLNGRAPSFPVIGLGSSKLDRERSWGASTSAEYEQSWFYVEGAAYLSYIDDYIYFAPEISDGELGLNETITGTFPVFTFRPTDAVFYGGELAGRIAPSSWPVEIEAQGSWVRAKDVNHGAGLTFIPADRYRLGLRYHLPSRSPRFRSHLGIQGNLVDRQRQADVTVDFMEVPPAYFLLGAEAGVAMRLRHRMLRFALTGSNLTNTRYREYTSLMRYFADEPGWDLRLRVSLDFDFSHRDRSLKNR